MSGFRYAVGGLLVLQALHAQSSPFPPGAIAARANYVSQAIDTAVNTPQLPAGFKGMIVGYQDDFGTVYKPYGVATLDGTVALNEKTVFGIGSATKLFAATLLGIADAKGLSLTTPVTSLLPAGISLSSTQNRAGIRLLDLADHHGGLPKNEGHLYTSLTDLYKDYAADPITCTPSTTELIHDCGCCDPIYMSLLGLKATCGDGVANPVYTCATHAATQGSKGWVYSNLGFEVLGNLVAANLGYPNWNQANLVEITQPLGMPDTMPLESFGATQVVRAADHCNPATRTTNANCQLLDWLPVGNPGGGLFSTAQDMLTFLQYNARNAPTIAANQPLAKALALIHQNYETSQTGGQELGWQTLTLGTGELMRWKDGSNGPFNSWSAYVTGSVTRTVVVLDNNGANGADLAAIAKQILLATGPAIGSVQTANGGAAIAQNTWMVIQGNNLTPPTTPPAGMDWSLAPEFSSNHMPTKLGDVSVTVNGKPAFLYFYCSAVTSPVCASDQINVLTPLDATTGPVPVVVTNGTASSLAFTATIQTVAPAFLLFDSQHIAATHADFTLLGATTLYPGYSTPAAAGEIVSLFGVGFGLPLTALSNGSSIQKAELPVLPVCRIGGTSAVLQYAGLISPGLYQINLTVPASAQSGENAVVCTYGGASTPSPAVITVR